MYGRLSTGFPWDPGNPPQVQGIGVPLSRAIGSMYLNEAHFDPEDSKLPLSTKFIYAPKMVLDVLCHRGGRTEGFDFELFRGSINLSGELVKLIFWNRFVIDIPQKNSTGWRVGWCTPIAEAGWTSGLG